MLDVALEAAGGSEAWPFLALYPDNRLEWPTAQAQVLKPGVPPPPRPGTSPVYLPLTLRGHHLYPPPPGDVTLSRALDRLATVEQLKMTDDLTDSAEPRKSANRDYAFDNPRHGMALVTSWR